MVKKLVLLLFFMLTISLFAHDQDTFAIKRFIKMKKTMCRGKCPVYQIIIKENYEVEFKGIANVDKIGDYKLVLRKSYYDTLKAAVDSCNFWTLKNKYRANVTDLSTTFITVYDNKRWKKIEDYYGAPAKLKKFEELISNILLFPGWEKISK